MTPDAALGLIVSHVPELADDARMVLRTWKAKIPTGDAALVIVKALKIGHWSQAERHELAQAGRYALSADPANRAPANFRNARESLRASPEEVLAWQRAAEAMGIGRATFIRNAANEVAMRTSRLRVVD